MGFATNDLVRANQRMALLHEHRCGQRAQVTQPSSGDRVDVVWIDDVSMNGGSYPARCFDLIPPPTVGNLVVVRDGHIAAGERAVVLSTDFGPEGLVHIEHVAPHHGVHHLVPPHLLDTIAMTR